MQIKKAYIIVISKDIKREKKSINSLWHFMTTAGNFLPFRFTPAFIAYMPNLVNQPVRRILFLLHSCRHSEFSINIRLCTAGNIILSDCSDARGLCWSGVQKYANVPTAQSLRIDNRNKLISKFMIFRSYWTEREEPASALPIVAGFLQFQDFSRNKFGGNYEWDVN